MSSIQSKEISSLFKKHSPQQKSTDSGSAESQIALLTKKIGVLTDHLQIHKKDKSSLQRGLKIHVGRRKKLLSYLCRKDIVRYRLICKNLKLKTI